MTRRGRENTTRLLCERCGQWLGFERFVPGRDGHGVRSLFVLRPGFIGDQGFASTSRLWKMSKHSTKRLHQGKTPGHRKLVDTLEPAFDVLTIAEHRVICPDCMLKQEIAPTD